jgi:hypothetical protein
MFGVKILILNRDVETILRDQVLRYFSFVSFETEYAAKSCQHMS